MSLSDPTKKMSKSLGENHVLYLFDEDYEKKLKKANANEEGLANLKKIAIGIGLNVEDYSMNIDLKIAIADKMKELFNI